MLKSGRGQTQRPEFWPRRLNSTCRRQPNAYAIPIYVVEGLAGQSRGKQEEEQEAVGWSIESPCQRVSIPRILQAESTILYDTRYYSWAMVEGLKLKTHITVEWQWGTCVSLVVSYVKSVRQA